MTTITDARQRVWYIDEQFSREIEGGRVELFLCCQAPVDRRESWHGWAVIAQQFRTPENEPRQTPVLFEGKETEARLEFASKFNQLVGAARYDLRQSKLSGALGR